MQVEGEVHRSSSHSGLATHEFLKSGAALIRLGSKDETTVTLTHKRLASLREILEQLKNERPNGVIITGPDPAMFTVGADISLFQQITESSEAEKAAKEGQALFQLLEDLPFPTVAAISGPCVGGGCELSLACNYRLISDAASSIIGLPEIKLGILPGFGGTQRLPRLIGLPKALDIILAGKTLRPSQALARGLVQEIVPTNQLMTRAERYATGAASKGARISFMDRMLTFTGPGRKIVRNKALANVMKQTRGFYPAPVEALDVAVYGLEKGLERGYAREAEALGKLLVSPESRALVNIFFRTEDAKGIGKIARRSVEHVQSMVIGAGIMGAGIAGSLARNECQVILKDTSEDSLKRGVDYIRSGLERKKYLSEKDRSFILNRIETTTRDSSNTGNVQIAIEAVFEDLDLKKKLLSELAGLMPEDSIIASNTSSLSITEIATSIPKPERVIGMHFFNPVDKMPLVEVIRGELTSDNTIAKTAALASKLGKFPIIVNDVPGFLVNRVLTPYLNESGHLLTDGFSIESIDAAAKSFGLPMGPIRLLDEVGLDVAAHVSEIMTNGYGARMQPSEGDFVKKLLAAGRKGKKSSSGFYQYIEGKESSDPEVASLLGLAATRGKEEQKHIIDRLILSLANEAVLCLDEGVAGAPGRQAAQQIDLGTVMGMGFPPFRGGLIYYLESLGAKAIYEQIQQLHSVCGARFTAVDGIKARAERGLSFYDAL